MSEPANTTSNSSANTSSNEDMGRGLTGLSSAWPLRVDDTPSIDPQQLAQPAD